MSETNEAGLNPSVDDFAALLEESFSADSPLEGTVVRGRVTAIENDLAIVDVGLKTEGRVPLKEFAMAGQAADLSIGDEVEVFLDRIENAMGEAVLSRDKARREESWVKLEKKFEADGGEQEMCSDEEDSDFEPGFVNGVPGRVRLGPQRLAYSHA